MGRPLTRLGRALLGAGLLVMAGCAVGPDYTRPTTDAGARFTADPLPSPAAQQLDADLDVPADWWTLFHSAALDALIAQALRANPDLAAARASLRQAREAVAVARGSYLPQVEGSASDTRERESGAAFGSPNLPASIFSIYSASVSVSYVPDLFGATRRQVEESAAQEDYARFELEATRLTLISNVVTGAIQEASLRGQIAATEQILEAERAQLDVIRRQFELGAADQATVLSQQATLAATDATLPPLQKQLAQTRTQLAIYAGRLPAEDEERRFTLDAIELPPTLPLELPSKLVEQRPDIRAAEAELHSASAAVGVAVANMLPQIKLTGSYGDTSVQIGNLFQPGNAVWSLGASLTQPLLDEVTLLHRKRSAEAAFDQAAAEYRSTVLKSFQDVANALHAIGFDAEAFAAETRAERAAFDSLELSRRQYALGAVSFPTLLDAQKTWQQARLSLVQAAAARYSDSAVLVAALGGGWWNRADAAGPDDANHPGEQPAP